MLVGAGVLDRDVAPALMAKYPYHTSVFLFPPWKEIYQTDAERDHTFEHAVTVYRGTRDWYVEMGYKVIDVKQGPAEARADEVLSALDDREKFSKGNKP